MALVDESSNQTPRYIHYDPNVNGGQLVATYTPTGNTDTGSSNSGGGGGDNSGGGGGGGGGGAGYSPPTLGGFDWQDYLGMFGLPSDVQAEIDKIFAQSVDVNTAAQLALSYIRGTDWYAQTYPGIKEGIAKGIVSNEADYRAYLNQANILYEDFYGRSISSNELADLLNRGVDLPTLGKQLNAAQDLTALQKLSIAGLFTPSELQQIANQNAGLASETGSYLSSLLGYTQQVASMYNQYGQPLSRQTIENNYRNGVTTTQVGQQLQGAAYVQANKPEIQYLSGAFGKGALSNDQLTALGNEQAGYDTPLGQLQQKILSRAQQIQNRIFTGTLATPSLSLGSNGIQAPSLQGVKTAASADVGA